MTGEAYQRARASYGARMALFYGASFLVVGSYMPYMPVWLDWQGLTAAEIAVVMAVPMFVRILFTPLMSLAADRLGDRRRMLVALSLATLVACGLMTLTRSFWPILLVATLYALAWTTILPLSEVVAMRGVRAFGLDYGRMRLWGSATFIVASLSGGAVLQAVGPQAALWVLIVAAAATAAAAFLLPAESAVPEAVAGDAPRPRVGLATVGELMRRRPFLLFIAAASLVQASHAILYAFGTLHLRKLGHSELVIGGLWAIGVVAEIALFWVAGSRLRRASAASLLLAGALAAVLRWPAMALDPPLSLLVLLQVLHGATFGAVHLGAIRFLAAAVPEQAMATAQGLYATLASGVVMGLAMMAAGPLYAHLEGAAFHAMAVPALAAALASLTLARVWDGRALWAHERHDPGLESAPTAQGATGGSRDAKTPPQRDRTVN